MDKVKRVTISVITVLLIIVFIVELGNNITGYSILNRKIDLSSYPLPFVMNNLYNDLYIVVPDSYNFNELVAADKIALGLQDGRLGKPIIIKENQIPQGTHNLIIVGKACDMQLISESFRTSECTSSLDENKGLIKFIDVGTKKYLIVTGYSDEDILKAATILRNYKTYDLYGKEIIVSGDTKNILSLGLEIK
jgi:hypothetical protein